jgi:hypothetical protein
MSYFETAGGVPPHESHTGLWIGGTAALIAFIAAVFLVVSANTPRVSLHPVSLTPPPSVSDGTPVPASSPAP